MNKPAVRLSRVTKSFPAPDQTEDSRVREGRFYALDNVSFDIETGVCTVIAGANGSGKSLLMSIIAGLEDPDSGDVEIAGKTGLIFQDADSQILGETPREDIAVGIGENTKRSDIPAIVERSLGAAGLLSRADFPSRFLSGGEKRRLGVAGVLAMNAGIIIFDEPYANLDYSGVVQVNTLIRDLLAESKTIVILTHELEKCLALAKNFTVLYEGKIVFNGRPEEALRGALENWGIHNPLRNSSCPEDLVWL
jgi:biotin transport system ATP-binding protein